MRLAGQATASSPRAFSLVKVSVPSVFGAALAEAWNVMLLSASMVNAFICPPRRAVGPRGHHTDHSGAGEHQVKSASALKKSGAGGCNRGKWRSWPFYRGDKT